MTSFGLPNPAPICSVCGERDYSAWGDRPCMCAYPPDDRQEPPGPTVEDICGSSGHVVDQEDGQGHRFCYCGKVHEDA